MTYEEKAALLENLHKQAYPVIGELVDAYENNDIVAISKLSRDLKKAYMPIVNMYTDELNKAINPTRVSTVPVVIMLLKRATTGLLQHNPDAAGVVEMFEKMFATEVLQISKNVGVVT